MQSPARHRRLVGGPRVEAAVRPSDIVVDAPRLNRSLRISQADEPALVQALVPEPAVEALGIPRARITRAAKPLP